MREQILDAAVTEFTSKGYRQASVSAIAARAGLTKGGLVHHFSTKDSLLEAVLSERTARRRVNADQIPRPSEEVPILEELRYSVEANQRDLAWPRFFTILVAESLTEAHPAFEAVEHRYAAMRGVVARGLESELAIGPERAAELAALFVAVMDGLQVQQLLDPHFDMLAVYDAFVAQIRDA